MSSKLLVGALALGLLCGCNTVTHQSGSVDPAFGEAAKYNMAVQVIDPNPVYHEDAAQPGESGARAADAVKRYRTGQVKQVEQVTTTSGRASGPQ